MVDLQNVTIEKVGDTVVVTGELKPRVGKEGRKRFYPLDAVTLAKQKFPNLKLANTASGSKITNSEGQNKGEWVIQLLKEETKKPVAPEVLADAKQELLDYINERNEREPGFAAKVDAAEPPKKTKKTKKRTRKTLKSVKEESKEVTGD